MAYPKPSHDVFHRPGDEGSCPAMPFEEIGGKSFPNGDNPSVSVGDVTPTKTVTIDHSGGKSSNPTEAMPGA